MTTFQSNEIPDSVKLNVDRDSIVRCPHNIITKKGYTIPCNKILYIGKVPKDPQEIKCSNCKNKTIVAAIE